MVGPVLISTESALEFFRTALQEAMEYGRLTVDPLTEWYVVELLTSQLHDGIDPGDTLADRYATSLSAAHAEKSRLLRGIGDAALVSCGLWADRELRPRHPMDARYLADIGRMAYALMSDLQRGTDREFMPEVFAELADRFPELVDALIRLATRHSLSTARDILRLYMVWEKTHSRHAARALAEQGVMVGTVVGSRAPS